MSSPYVTLGNRSLDQWKVTELREELKKRKLTTKGLKEDLVKRLDEAVRTERASALESANNDVAESEITPEQTLKEPVMSGRAKNVGNVGVNVGEKVDEKPDHVINDSRGSLNEVNVVEADTLPGTKAAGLEGEQVSNVEATDLISEKVEPVTPFSGGNVHSDVVNAKENSTEVINNDGLPPRQEDAKLEVSDLGNQSHWINEHSLPLGPSSGSNIHGSETDNEAAPSTIQMESDDSKVLQTDSSAQPLKYQVSEADPNLGLQVTSDSVSTESVSIIEKNELKVDVITDNVQLELDVKHQTVQPSPGVAVQDGGKSHPMDVEEPLSKKEYEEPLDKKDAEEPIDKKNVEEPIEKKDFEEPLHKKDIEDPFGEKESTEATVGRNTETLDSLKNTDSGDLGPHEKLNLDRSSGDDSMEEDVLESKQMEYKSEFNKFGENVEKSRMPIVKEDEHVDVVGQDKPVEMKVSNVENDTVNALASVKRKFHDKEAVGNNEPVKKVRRWNAEGLKSSETHSGGIVTSATPKGSSEPTFKRSESDLAANEEAPMERVVPPSSKPPTDSLRIDRFLRPFTLKAVQELLGKTGNVTSFWMDQIKTHCYVTYSSVEEAVETRNAVYNLQWPANGGRLLVAEFVDSQEVKARLEAPLPSPVTPSSTAQPQPSPRQQIQRQQVPPPSLPPPPLSNPPPLVRERLREPLPKEQPLPARERLTLPPPPPLPEKVDPPIVTLDDLFRKTKAMPRIYYLPLSDEQVAAKLKTQGKDVINQ